MEMPERDDLLRGALRRLPRRVPPPELATALRALASREQERRKNRRTAGQIWLAWMDRLRFSTAHMVRPLALPLAGGITSAVVMFSMLVPHYPVRAAGNPDSDVPTVLTTEVSVKGTAPFALPFDEVVVDVMVNVDGRLVDYSIVSPHAAIHNDAIRRAIESQLLFAIFSPATIYGQPRSGKLRLSFRSSRIEVRG
jgi:hypothetical protein